MWGGGWNEKKCIPDGFLTPALGWDCFFPPLSSPPLLLIKFAAYQSGSLLLSWEVLLHQQHLSIKSLWTKKHEKEKHGSLPQLCDFFNTSTVLHCTETALFLVTSYNLPQFIIKDDGTLFPIICQTMMLKGFYFMVCDVEHVGKELCRLSWLSHTRN